MPEYYKWKLEVFIICLILLLITAVCVFISRKQKSSSGVFAAPKHLNTFNSLIEDGMLKIEGEGWLWSFINKIKKINPKLTHPWLYLISESM